MATFKSSVMLYFAAVLLPVMPVLAAEPATDPLLGASQGNPLAAYDLEMMTRPKLPLQNTAQVYPEGLRELWMKALDRPDAELRRITIDTIAIAHRRKMPGIKSLRPRIVELLKQPSQRLDVVKAAAKLLIAFESRDLDADLADQAVKRGIAVSRLVEPALADWKSPAMQKRWLARLTAPTVSEEMLILAIDGLAALGDQAAKEDLQRIALTSTAPITVRLHAANALGSLDIADAVQLSKQLEESTATTQPVASLLAIRVLRSASGQAAVDRLTELTKHSDSAVQSQALQRLYEIDRKLVNALADDLVDSSDANVRLWCLKGMLHKPAAKRVQSIAPLLNDPIPEIRKRVTKELLQWSDAAAMKDEVIAQTIKVLEQDGWRGCEQAIVVLARLDHDPAGERFVQLLKHDRGEVKVASAWGLQQIRSKEQLPAMLDHAQSVYDGFRSGKISDGAPGVVLQMTHLFTAFGDQMYAPSEDLLRTYVRKDLTLGTESRAAAGWAIGLLLAEDAPKDIVDLLIERFCDTEALESETAPMRQMCAISLGRMKAQAAMSALREYGTGHDAISRACYWAIERITGDAPPPIEHKTTLIDEWSLAPVHNE